jgi:hypothetical protein
MRNVKYALVGTPDQVKRENEALHKIGCQGELEWFGWFFDQGFMSLDEEMRQNGGLRQAHYSGCPLSPTTRLRLSPLGAPLAQAGSEYLCNRLHKLRTNESVCEAEVTLLGGAVK